MWILDIIKFCYNLIPSLWHWIRTQKFRQVFGSDVGVKYYIIYNIHRVPDKHIIFQKPEHQVKRALYAASTNLTYINSCATTRAIGYIVYAFGEKVNVPPIISSDVDTDTKMDISFVSLGGLTNLKTCDILDKSNYSLCFYGDSIIHEVSKIPIVSAENEDYGLIIKIHPPSNPKRTWI